MLAYREGKDTEVKSVYESLICNEFLEDFFPHPEHPALFPLSAIAKARARIIIDRFDHKFVPKFYSLLLRCFPARGPGFTQALSRLWGMGFDCEACECRQGRPEREAVAQEMVRELQWLEGEVHPEGPYFLGKEFSAVDCAILPWFIRLFVLKHYRGFELPKDCKKLVDW